MRRWPDSDREVHDELDDPKNGGDLSNSRLHRPPEPLSCAASGYGSGVRRVDVEHLVGARAIAERLGLVRVQAVHYLRRTDPAFPEPVWASRTQGGTGCVWYWPDVWKWARAAGYELAPLPKSVPGTRRIAVEQLVGGRAIAERLGLRSVERVSAMRREDPSFPAPVYSSLDGPSAKRLWAWPDVWRWAKDCGRVFSVELGRSPSARVSPRPTE